MMINKLGNKNYIFTSFFLNYLLIFSPNAVASNSQAVYPVLIDPNLLASDNGALNEKTTVAFLQKAYDQGLLSKEDAHFPNPKCIRAKELGTKGAQTLKLFAIEVNSACLNSNSNININSKFRPFFPNTLRKSNNVLIKEDYHTDFILKEMTRGADEANNLHAAKNSELKELMKSSNGSNSFLPTLAFPIANLSYQDLNKKNHVLALLNAAKGQEIKSLHNELATHHQENTTHLKDYTDKKDFLSSAFYSTGRALGAMHYKYMEPAGTIFGLTHVHADLHMENVFFDGREVTFIDNETFVISLSVKQSILVDVVRFIGFTISQPNKRYFHSDDIPVDTWRTVAVEPFLKGYIAGYPADKKAEVTARLKELFLSTPNMNEVWRGAVDDKSQLWETAKEKYLRPAFAKIG